MKCKCCWPWFNNLNQGEALAQQEHIATLEANVVPRPNLHLFT